jgi:4-amino-4-deoxy-L-arabinose transferase-like glycosyltransferase
LEDTYFWADENVHAYIASVVFETHRIPFYLPEAIYGIFKNAYPPFFHILGASLISIAGFSAIKYLNLGLLVIFLFSFYYLIRKHYGKYEAVLASLLLSLSPVIAINAVRFMTEMLSMALMFFSFFYTTLSIKEQKKQHAIIAGISTGLLLLSKQIGTVVLGFYVLLFVWFLIRERENARFMIIVIGLSAAIYLPYFILCLYNKVAPFDFISIWLGNNSNEPKWAVEAVTSFRRFDSGLKEFLYLFFYGNGIIISLASVVPVIYFFKTRFNDSPQQYLFLLLIYLSFVMAIWHITNDRHTITILPLLAFLAAFSCIKLIPGKGIVYSMTLLLFVAAIYSVISMPNYRNNFNAPEDFRLAADIIREDDFKEERVFSIYPVDILMYTKKNVIWPWPNLHDIPVDIMQADNPSSFSSLLDKYNIRYILIDNRFVSTRDYFHGRNYTSSFYYNCRKLYENNELTVKLQTKSFILLKVS